MSKDTTSSPNSINTLLPAVALLECCHCGNEIEEDYYRKKDNEIYCDRCHSEQFEFTCPICEEYCEKSQTPQEHYVYLHEEMDGYKPGFYNVVKFPVYISDMFSATLCSDALQLASEMKVYKLDKDENPSGFICKGCFDKKGLDEWHVQNHIRQAAQIEYNEGKYKDYKKVIVTVSPEYFKILEGKVSWEKFHLIEDAEKKTQGLSVCFEM